VSEDDEVEVRVEGFKTLHKERERGRMIVVTKIVFANKSQSSLGLCVCCKTLFLVVA
jgi:hypothetical protein